MFIKPLSTDEAVSVRQIGGTSLGQLVTVRGIVTRVSDVKPFLQVNTYSCDTCGSEIFQEIKQRQFTPLTECPSDECRSNNVKGRLYMMTRACKFLAFQEVKLQELVMYRKRKIRGTIGKVGMKSILFIKWFLYHVFRPIKFQWVIFPER